jgi:deoxycytidylate deaminase
VDAVQKALREVLDAADYDHVHYRLSEMFESLSALLPRIETNSEYRRLETAMDAGDELRRLSRRPEIMAIQAAAWIAEERPSTECHLRRAHVLRSLKREEEVQYLRRLYGPRFVLISVYLPREQRVAELVRQGMSVLQATTLVVRDEDDGSDHGQATRDAFHLADIFIDGGSNNVTAELSRFFDLILGSPSYTPTQTEHGMFLAYATSLRSGDLSRQVGAIVTTADGTLIAEGCNDAPRYGGGPQWPDGKDTRDIVRRHDSNERIKRQIVDKLRRGFEPADRERAEAAISNSGVLDITEYGRAVHAEMAALMACARLGVSTRGCTLYCTTFPCHNCAKHIVAAGIEIVRFIEPYPKSRALDLHDDAISLQDVRNKVALRPFVGVGPRRYEELFALRDQYGARVRRKQGGACVSWDRCVAIPAVHDRLVTYVELESNAMTELAAALDVARSARMAQSLILSNNSLAPKDT